MRLQTKLLLHSFISIFIALIILSFVIMKMINMQTTANDFTNTLLKIEQLNSSMVSYQQALGNYGRNPTESNQMTAITRYNDAIKKVEQLGNVPPINEEATQRIQFIDEKMNIITDYMDTVVYSRANNTIEAMQMSSKIHGIINDIYLLSPFSNEQYYILEKENNNQIVIISFTSGLILLIVSSVISMIITRRIVFPIKQLGVYSERIASGDLSIKEINTKSEDEVGHLTRSFNVMKNNLSQLIQKIQNNADELKEKNERIHDSINYAKRIQESVIPNESQFNDSFLDYFIIWRPRDIVGGDFYWYHKSENGFYVAIGDCTGHGVPGALMTTLSISALNHIIKQEKSLSPAEILEQLNQTIKKQLNQESKSGQTDDGLDIGILFVEGSSITYAGAKLTLYQKTDNELIPYKGDKKSIGYRRTPLHYTFSNQSVMAEKNATFYITTDGYIDQNGGEKDYSFGKNKFSKLIEKVYPLTLERQKEIFTTELETYMKEEPQRDDITVLAFRL